MGKRGSPAPSAILSHLLSQARRISKFAHVDLWTALDRAARRRGWSSYVHAVTVLDARRGLTGTGKDDR